MLSDETPKSNRIKILKIKALFRCTHNNSKCNVATYQFTPLNPPFEFLKNTL